MRLMDKDRPLRQRFQALSQGIFPPRKEIARTYGFSPTSWQTTLRYLPYSASHIRRYWGYFIRLLQSDPRQVAEAQSTVALEEWLGING